MKQVIGECRYCKQTMSIEVPEDWTDSDITDEVTKRCTCPEATGTIKVENLITSTEADLKMLFDGKDILGDMQTILTYAIKPLATAKVDKISISRGAYTAKMSRSAKGIKIKLEQKTEEVTEATAK